MEFHVGDIVTSGEFYWLNHYHAEIIYIDYSKEIAILKMIKNLDNDHQWVEGHQWSLWKLILVKKFNLHKRLK